MTGFRMIDTGEVTLRAAVEGTGPLVLMVHGFPESWYSWRHQMAPIAAAGFTACAIDVRGYGGSDKPHAVEAYAMEHVVADLVAVADVLSPGAPAILVGHDWGAPIVWHGAVTRPDRFKAVAGLSVPFSGIARRPFTEIFDEIYTQRDRFFYQAWFQKQGPPEAEAQGDIRGFLRRMYYAISGDAPAGTWPEKRADATLLEGMVDPDPFPAWLSDADIDYYVGEFEASGLRGPLNRYRNHERDFTWTRGWAAARIEQPCLFVGGAKDPATTLFGAVADPVATMRAFAPRVEGHILPGIGHWTQQEAPEAVTRLLVDWLDRVR